MDHRLGIDDDASEGQCRNHDPVNTGEYHKKDRGLSMGFVLLLCAFAFILVYWVTAWVFFKTLATVCAVAAIVIIAVGLIKNIFVGG